MAVNKNPWIRNDGGATKPLILMGKVEAGSSYTIKRGEICKLGKNSAGYFGAVDTATDSSLLTVANEEQKADDAARFIEFIIPRQDDLFEFEMAAARAVKIGETFAVSTSQKLAYATSNVIFRCAADPNYPLSVEDSTSIRSMGFVQGYFDENASYITELTGNS